MWCFSTGAPKTPPPLDVYNCEQKFVDGLGARHSEKII